ncbi:Fanconi anemia core complex-associated protein 100 [Gadus macrocephalus]|uniref:Fanconi anemia core complex-associated protein 100 n=1 Tax=Gadus macrocephalus TaxID=80720 RepID=UPI0028CBB2D7|nr:Fanconi anemia core complex-associated protein 100 [Gadus macrocephalus]
MEGRCAVETWAKFGNVPSTAKVTGGTLVFICDGSDEVNIFHIEEKRIMTTLQFPGPICYLVQSEDKHLIYAACESAVYCVNIHILKSRIPTGSAPAPSLSISSDWLAVREERVCSLLLVGSILLTLTQKGGLWQFTLYKVPASVESSASGHEKLGVLELPVVSPGLYEDGDQRRTPARKPVLNCVHSSDAVPTSSSSSSSPSSPSHTLTGDGHFLLEPLLFRMIFGVDAALAKSPIILCGLPDGRLCFFPLRGLPSRVRVLHSLEQPIVFIGSTVAMGTDPPLPQSLVAVGGLGRVVLIHTGGTAATGTTAALASGAGQKPLAFTEGCVPGPVVCGCVEGRRLYYSTHSDVLVLDLSGGPEQQGATALRGGEDVGDGLPSPVSLNVCGVVALGRATHTAAAAGAVQFLALSARGRLQSITVPKAAAAAAAGGGEEAQGRELPSLPSSQVGQRIKDLLSAIGDVCERATVLKASIHSKTEVLRQLNQVLHISSLLLSDHNKEDHLPVQKRPIRCQTLSQWSRVLQRDTLNLTCVLQNTSPYVLEQGWTFCVTLQPLSHPLGEAGEGSSRTLSFPILDLRPGGEFEVSLPLATAGDTSFPVTVRCSLVFMLARLLAEEKPAAPPAGGHPDPSLPGLGGGCFSLPVDTLTVDWLDALRVCKPGDGNKDGGFPPTEGASVDPLQAFLDVREVVGRGRSGDTGGALRSKAGGGHSACVRVCQQSLSAALEWAAAGAAPRGSEGAPSLSSAVLDWLLPSSGPGGGGTSTRAVDDAVVSARCPGGRPVRLTAKEVTVGEQGVETGGGGLKTVEIWVECPSMASVCGLHHAVLGRVQTLLQRAPENRASAGGIQSAVLRQAIQKAEAVLQRIQESRVPEGSGGDFTREKMNQSLLSIYHELRDNPLLIV